MCNEKQTFTTEELILLKNLIEDEIAKDYYPHYVIDIESRKYDLLLTSVHKKIINASEII